MNWLKQIRMQKKQTQEEISIKTGLSRASYSNIEIGVRRPSVKTAKKIASVLGFDWTRFYEDQDESK